MRSTVGSITEGNLVNIHGPHYTMQLLWGSTGNPASGNVTLPLANKATTFFISGTGSTGLFDYVVLNLIDGHGTVVDFRSWSGSWSC